VLQGAFGVDFYDTPAQCVNAQYQAVAAVAALQILHTMNRRTLGRSAGLLLGLSRRAASLLLMIALGLPALLAADAGGVSGAVISTATRNGLQGALISVPALGRSEFSDASGSFLIQGLPAGSVDLVVSYAGFDNLKLSATVRAGQITRVAADMKPAQTIVMEAFTVATQKEGQALAITEQRNALNVKNVTAFDEWASCRRRTSANWSRACLASRSRPMRTI
jgi:hypothetical protein